MRRRAGLPETLRVDIGSGRGIDFVLIPPGRFVMGRDGGPADEGPARVREVARPFYMSVCEISNGRFRAVADPGHSSGFVSWRSVDWRTEGYPLDGDGQPAVRVSWHEAMKFCEALSRKCGRRVTLPDETQWEWACRAGTATPFWYGGENADFSRRENLSGREKEKMAFWSKPRWFLRDNRFSDGHIVTAPVGSFAANPWGLRDMHGNVCEWTRSRYGGPGGPDGPDEYVVRGGSWDDCPRHAFSSRRWKYPAWRKIHNVGFRVIIEPPAPPSIHDVRRKT